MLHQISEARRKKLNNLTLCLRKQAGIVALTATCCKIPYEGHHKPQLIHPDNIQLKAQLILSSPHNDSHKRK